MKTLTALQIQRIDRLAIDKYGIPSLVLMENAGAAVAREIIHDRKRLGIEQVCVFCGTGNNGGDGFVVARHLMNAGIKVKVFLVGREKDLSPEAAINFRILKKSGYSIKRISGTDREAIPEIKRADLLVDALFGVGLNREIGEPWRTMIAAMNVSGKPILAVDVPSGLDATSGKIFGIGVRAHKTVTFTFAKNGFFKNDGPRHVGKVCVVDIGIPARILRLYKGESGVGCRE